ncbi:hypothetical protein V5O48_011015 [Marasmius crinis-equi]|uniref:Uncharacterized protein n=1 Tax=Marasmius crinis-equi TaxID=585013 RepID=A0ABR3F6S7_9AGAR
MRRNYDIPEPPIGVSEPEWVRMLFDGTCCQARFSYQRASVLKLKLGQVCGVRGVNRLDFILRKRICYKCVKLNGVNAAEFQSSYATILECVLPSQGCSVKRRALYYNKNEIETVLFEIRKRSEPEQEEYIKERKSHLAEVLEVAHHIGLIVFEQDLCISVQDAKRLERWMSAQAMKKKEEAYGARDARFEEIKARLLLLNCSEEEISFIKYRSWAKSQTPLTERAWKMMKPRLLRTINQRRQHALIQSQPWTPDSDIDLERAFKQWFDDLDNDALGGNSNSFQWSDFDSQQASQGADINFERDFGQWFSLPEDAV